MKRSLEQQQQQQEEQVEVQLATKSTHPFSPISSPTKKVKVSPTQRIHTPTVLIDLTQPEGDDDSEHNPLTELISGHECRRCKDMHVKSENLYSCDWCCKRVCNNCYDKELDLCTKCLGPEKDENGCNRFGKCDLCNCKCFRDQFIRCEECDVRTCGGEFCYITKTSCCPDCDSIK